MVRCAQLVMGPAGSGKSTYCDVISKHCEVLGRSVRVFNLDPAAEFFSYPVAADVRDLIQLDDVMDDDTAHFGPNGGLIFCMEYLAKNLEWLVEQLEEDVDDDYVIFDCPGQIELYTHLPIMRQLVEQLQHLNFRVCAVFLLDSQFMIDTPKFFSGILAALSVMVTLEVPHVNVMSKIDMLTEEQKNDLEKYIDPNPDLLNKNMGSARNKSKFFKLNKAIAKVIDEYSLVKFHPFDITDEESIGEVLAIIDDVLQFSEDQEVKEPRELNAEDDNDNDGHHNGNDNDEDEDD